MRSYNRGVSPMQRHIPASALIVASLALGATESLGAEYPGAGTPGLKPLLFAPGFVSTPEHSEFGGNFHPDGTEYYFTRRPGGDGTAEILVTRWEDGAWTHPRTVEFSGVHFDYQPGISRDGKRLFFGSMRPPSGSGPGADRPDIWFAPRQGSEWGQPVHSEAAPADGRAEFVSITNEHTLYFGEWLNGQTSNIHRSRRQAGGYPESEALLSPINTSASDAHPLIAPDGSFLIFDSTRPGGFGNSDLYITFLEENGTWTEPQNLGRRFNTAGFEVNPGLSHDGARFFFHRNGDIYWVDARALGIYRPLVSAHSDFDGDGTSDPAVFDPQNAQWKVMDQFTRKFGTRHSIPVTGDFDGDGTTDLAYFLPREGLWSVRQQFSIEHFGAPGDIPVPGDYDGDGATDIAFFRPFTGSWHFAGIEDPAGLHESREAHHSSAASTHVSVVEFGQLGDLPVPADYDGDGVTDLAVFRPSTRRWLVAGRPSVRFGKAIDIPVPADYDGDGTADYAVWSPKTGRWSVRRQFKRRHGPRGAIPVPGDYDGDGRADLAFFDPLRSTWNVEGQLDVQFGGPGDRPLVLGN